MGGKIELFSVDGSSDSHIDLQAGMRQHGDEGIRCLKGAIKDVRNISRRVAVRRLSDSPLLQTSGNCYFLFEMMDTLQSLQ